MQKVVISQYALLAPFQVQQMEVSFLIPSGYMLTTLVSHKITRMLCTEETHKTLPMEHSLYIWMQKQTVCMPPSVRMAH